MEPVLMNAMNISGKFAAAGKIAFGAVCMRSAAGEIKATASATMAYIGVADNDNVEKDVEGFYSDGDAVPLITSGTCRVWMLGGVVSQAGDFIRLIPTTIIGNDTDFIGVCTEEATATTRTVNTVGKIIEADDIGSTDYVQLVETTSNSGQKVVTMSAAKITALALSAGDYILVSDLGVGSEVQVVDSVSSTAITCTENLVNTYTAAADTNVYRLSQAEVELL